MTKRARYNGQYDVAVAIDTGNVFSEFVHVVPGGLLPDETDRGTPVPASVRDDLIANNPDWSEYKQADQRDEKPSKPAGEKGGS